MNQSNSMFESAAKSLEEAQKRFEMSLKLSHLRIIRDAKEEEVERLSQELERARKNLNVAEEALQSVKSLILEKEEQVAQSIQRSAVHDQKVYGELHEFEEALLEPIFDDLPSSSFRKEIDEALPIKNPLQECDCETIVDNQVHEIVESVDSPAFAYDPKPIPIPSLNGKRKKF